MREQWPSWWHVPVLHDAASSLLKSTVCRCLGGVRHLAHLAQQPRWRLVLWLLTTASLVAVLGGSWMLAASMSTPTRPPLTKHIAPVFSTSRDHLLMYAFSYSDPQYLENLRYFITEAIANDTVADHVIIVQEGPSLKVRCQLRGSLPWGHSTAHRAGAWMHCSWPHCCRRRSTPTLQKAKLPELPPHAAYVRHQNECYDWGSYGWVLLQTGLVSIAKYRYFFFVNSSVRGPFLPAYARVSGPVTAAAFVGPPTCSALRLHVA